MPAGFLPSRKAAVVKKAISAIVVVFLIYFLLTNPTGAANTVELVFTWIINALGQLAAFFQTLLS